MKFGLHGINYDSCNYPETMIRVAQTAEAIGFESLWTGEYVVLPDPAPAGFSQPPDRPYLDPLIALTYSTQQFRNRRMAALACHSSKSFLWEQAAGASVLSGLCSYRHNLCRDSAGHW